MKLKELIVGILFIHFTFWFFNLNKNYNLQSGFIFIFKKEMTILAFTGLFYLEEFKELLKIESFKNIYKILKTQLFSIIIFAGILSFAARALGYIHENPLNINYTTTSIATWCFAYLIFYRILKWRGIQEIESLILSFLLCRIGGVIYELPVYPQFSQTIGIWFHISHPFFIESTLLIIPCLIYYLTRKYSFDKRSLIAYIPYVLFSIFYASLADPQSLPLPIHRLPAILALAATIIGIKHKKEAFTPTHLA